MPHQLITKTYKDLTFTFRADGYFNMTKAAQCFGRKLSNFWASPETLEYTSAVAQLPGFKGVNLFETKSGRYGGTWAHPKLTVTACGLSQGEGGNAT